MIKRLRDVPGILNGTSVLASFMAILFFCGYSVKYESNCLLEGTRLKAISGLKAFAASDPSYLLFPVKETAAATLLLAKERGIYDLDQVGSLSADYFDRQATTFSATATVKIDRNDGKCISGWAFIPAAMSEKSKIFIVLANDAGAFRIRTLMMQRPDVSKAHHRQFLYDYSGFECFLIAYDIPPGRYRMGVLVENGRISAMKWLAKEFISHAE
jgi:hypothetical protein